MPRENGRGACCGVLSVATVNHTVSNTEWLWWPENGKIKAPPVIGDACYI